MAALEFDSVSVVFRDWDSVLYDHIRVADWAVVFIILVSFGWIDLHLLFDF